LRFHSLPLPRHPFRSRHRRKTNEKFRLWVTTRREKKMKMKKGKHDGGWMQTETHEKRKLGFAH